VFTREDIINLSGRMGCNQDLLNKGMVVTPHGNVFCLATLTGGYRDDVYFDNGIESPKEVRYFGVNSLRASHPFDMNDYEARKNIAVKKTDGKLKFVYFFERTDAYSDEYFFHGRYKYVSHDFIANTDPKRINDVLFHLILIDTPILK